MILKLAIFIQKGNRIGCLGPPKLFLLNPTLPFIPRE